MRRRMLDEMPNYGGFLSQLTSFIFIPIFGVLFLNRYLSGCLSEVSVNRTSLAEGVAPKAVAAPFP